MTPIDHDLPAPRPEALVPEEPGPVLVLGPDAFRLVEGHGPAWRAQVSTETLPEDTEFASVVLAGALGLADDPAELLRRVAACVRPGGTVVVTVPNARSWPVIRGLLEGTYRGDRPESLPAGTRHLLTRSGLVDLVEQAGLRTTRLDGTRVSESPPKEIEASLLALDLRSAGLAEEGGILDHHVVARRPEPDAAAISLLDPRSTGVRREGDVETVGGLDPGIGFMARMTGAVEASRGMILALGCGDAATARDLASRLDEWTDVVVRAGALVLGRGVLFGLGGLGGNYETVDGLVQDLVLRSSLGGRRVLRQEPVPDLHGPERDAFLDRHGWVRAVERTDPIPTVTAAGPVNPAGATLTVALIVRDEENCLASCLESVKPIADEIVVVDTGSRDRTPDIAREFGARVITFPWCDDFSAARNVSLDAVKTEWVLVLDADEILTPDAAERIRDALRDTSNAAYMLPLVNEGESTEAETAIYLLRLFRARPSIRFAYRIHEQVAGAVQRYARRNELGFSRLEGATIRHTGYVPEVVSSRGKLERNRRHFEAQLARYPRDLYSWYKYADFLRECGRSGDARAALERAFSLLFSMVPDEIVRLPFSGEVVALHALELVNADRLEEAWDATRLVAALGLDSAHAWYARGLAAVRTERHEEALEAFRHCRTYDGKTAAVPIDPGITGESASIGEAESLRGIGRKDEARALYFEILDRHSRCARALIGLMNLDDDVDRTLADVRARAGSGAVSTATRLTVAEALILLGRADRAARWLEETGSLEDPRVTSALGEIHLHAGHLEDAERVWSSHATEPSCRAGAILVSAMLGRAPDSPPDHETMTGLRTYLVNLRRSGREEVFRAAAQACVAMKLLPGSGAR